MDGSIRGFALGDIDRVTATAADDATRVMAGEDATSGRARSPRADAWRRFRAHRLSLISLVFFVVVVVVAVLAPVITGASPTAMTSLPLLPPSGAHLMGTDRWAPLGGRSGRLVIAVG